MSDKKKKPASIFSIPPFWHLTIGIHSNEWVTVTWYWWGYIEEGLKMAICYEWCLRRFWKIDKTP